MDDEQKTVNIPDEQNIGSDSSTEQENTSEVLEGGVQSEKTATSTQPERTDDGGQKQSGAQKRIHTLVDERDTLRNENNDLRSKLEELTSQSQVPSTDYVPQYGDQGERELTVDDLRTIARIEVEKERTLNRINTQAAQAVSDNPILNSKSDTFDPDVSEAVSTAVLNELRLDPTKDVGKLTEKYLKPYLKAAQKAVGEEKAILAQQANETTLRPTNVKQPEKTFSDLSIQEMEQRLGVVN